MDISFKPPFYAKAALIFVGLFSLVFVLHVGKGIIIPIVFATILAILLNPLVIFLVKKKVNIIVAIALAVLVTLTVALGLFYIISAQISMFTEAYPQLKVKVSASSGELVSWISRKFKIPHSMINAWMIETEREAIENFAIGEKISQVGETLVVVLILPVYLSMILYYKNLLLEFIRKLFRTEHHASVVAVLADSKIIIQNYLVGLFFEMIIVATLNATGLLLLGIDYAIILGITGAILNIIPYIGGVISLALAMSVAFVTKESASYPFLVLIIFLVIQFIDNHLIVPKIVASRVKINALISVIAVLIGNAIWGIPGMFLSIPLTAIIKVIFDHIEPLKPWGFLLGNTVPTSAKFAAFPHKKTKVVASRS